MSEIELAASSAALRRWVFRLFGIPLVGAVIASGAMVAIVHWRLGEKSPGVIPIALTGLHYGIPVLFILFFVIPSIRNLLLIRRLTRLARPQGLRWYELMDLPEEERARLGAQAGRDS